MKQVKQWQHLMFKRMVCICCAVCIALGCTSVCFASGVSGAGEVIYTNSHGADAEWIVENTAYEAEPYRWTDGTDHNIIYGFDMAEAPALSIRITVLMNYVVSISPDNVQWIEAANYGDISGGERIQSQDNETDIDIVFSEYGCTDMAYMKISNMDNAGDYGGAIKKFVLNPNQQTVDTQGLVADQIQKYSGDDLAKMAEKSATSGYPNRAAAGVEHQKGGLLYQNITTPVKEAKYDFTVGETIATNVQGADEAWIEEDKALSADPYRWTDGTDRYIIYRFDMSENPMLAVKVRVLMNYVVSVSSDKSAWTEVANWKDVAGGERIKSQANRTDVDVVFDKYGCEDIGYIKISNMDNAGDYGGAIERFTLMTAQLKNWYYVNPGDTLRAEVDVCLNDGSEGLTISVLNGDFGLKEHTVTRSEYEALEPKTTADYIDNLSYRTISIPFTMPTSESAADIAGRLQNSGFGITLAGPETGCQILGIRLVNETANAVVRDYTPSELLALAKDDSQPIPIERELKCWSALEKTIGVRDDCGPHLGTVYGAAVPFEDESGTPYYDEGDLIIITEHLYYDCDQDALPKEGPGPRTVAVNPGEYKEYADSNSVDMAEYHAMEIQQDDLYNGNPYREITFSFTIPSRSEAEIADRGFLLSFWFLYRLYLNSPSVCIMWNFIMFLPIKCSTPWMEMS